MRSEIFDITATQLIKLLGRNLVVAPVEKKKNGIVQGTLYNAETGIKSEKVFNEKEQEILQWVLKNRKRAGAMTERFSEEPYLYLSIYAAQNRYGVIGIFIGQKPLDAFENSILLSILGECAMALDREQSAREKEEAAVMAKNEQLRVNLLRTISHDLRTPLTSILGNADSLDGVACWWPPSWCTSCTCLCSTPSAKWRRPCRTRVARIPSRVPPWVRGGGFFTGLAETIEYVMTAATIVYFSSAYADAILSNLTGYSLDDHGLAWVWWLALYAIFVVVNWLGAETSFRFAEVVSIAALAIVALFGIGAFTTGKADFSTLLNITPTEGNSAFLPFGPGAIFYAMPFAMWLFLGIEQLPLAAEEVREPERTFRSRPACAFHAGIVRADHRVPEPGCGRFRSARWFR